MYEPCDGMHPGSYFVAIDCGEEQMKPAKQTVKEQKMEHQEGGMMLCSQS